MVFDLKKIMRERDKSARGIAGRTKQIFLATSGRPPFVDDDESVRAVSRCSGKPTTRRDAVDDEG